MTAFTDGNDRSVKKTKLDGERKRFDSDLLKFLLFFFLFFPFFKADSTLGEALGKYSKLLPVLGDLADVTTVKDLVANEALQQKLLIKAGDDELLMEGFIGRCKAIMSSSQQSPPAVSPVTIIQGEKIFSHGFCLSAFFQ